MFFSFSFYKAAVAIYILASATTVFGVCSPDDPSFCTGTSFVANSNSTYICGDVRLGPKDLPANPPTDSFYKTYDRLGGYCPGQFLATFYDKTAKSWIYPPYDGFSLNTAGQPIASEMTLPVGLLIDRFGSEYGSYASPAAAPYMQRALPPSNLNTATGNTAYPYNYHLYRVIEAFEVIAGPIAPWFGQPGQGVQYMLNSSILSLIEGGFLERANLTAL